MPLTEQQRSTLRAATDRVVPADGATGPGALAAGAADYLLAQLDGGDLAPLMEDYGAFLDRLDAGARSESGTQFAALPPDRRDELLRAFEADLETGRFFRRFVEHVQEGFYTSPVSWAMIGWKVMG